MTQDELVEALMTVELPSCYSQDWNVEYDDEGVTLGWSDDDIFNLACAYRQRDLFDCDDAITNAVRYGYMNAAGDALVRWVEFTGEKLPPYLDSIYEAALKPGLLADRISWQGFQRARKRAQFLDDSREWSEALDWVADNDLQHYYRSQVFCSAIELKNQWHIEIAVDFWWQSASACQISTDLPKSAMLDELRNVLEGKLPYYMTGGLVDTGGVR